MILRPAILHIPLSQYAFSSSSGLLTIRLRAAKGNLNKCELFFADRAFPGQKLPFNGFEMKLTANCDLFDYFEVTFKSPYTRVCYYFKLASGSENIFYYADRFSRELPLERSEYYQYPFMRREEISEVPQWFMDSVVYNIFPDSFASGRRIITKQPKNAEIKDGIPSVSKLGGTLLGITANLDYIRQLGCNCLYLNPIFTAGEYHKYDLIDYYNVDPCFGTNEDFKNLVEQAHQLGMRVIIDGVFNHCGWNFFAFKDLLVHGEKSVYSDWFYEVDYPVVIPETEEQKPCYSCFAYERKMPKLNTSNEEVRQYFSEVCRYWTREYNIDGWRLDVANEVDRDFWRMFRKTARQENPECVLIGEIWESAESWLQGDMFDSTMNYEFRNSCRDFFALGKADAAEFDSRATQMRMRYSSGVLQGQLNLIDSHDVIRFLSLCKGDQRRLRLAVLFLTAFPGVPSIFYGDELGLEGISEDEYRQPMPWDKAGSTLHEFYKKAIALRSFECLKEGGYETLNARQGDMLYIFKRSHEEGALVFALNACNKPAKLSIVPDNADILMEQEAFMGELPPFGYLVWRE